MEGRLDSAEVGIIRKLTIGLLQESVKGRVVCNEHYDGAAALLVLHARPRIALLRAESSPIAGVEKVQKRKSVPGVAQGGDTADVADVVKKATDDMCFLVRNDEHEQVRVVDLAS